MLVPSCSVLIGYKHIANSRWRYAITSYLLTLLFLHVVKDVILQTTCLQFHMWLCVLISWAHLALESFQTESSIIIQLLDSDNRFLNDSENYQGLGLLYTP